MKRTYKYRAWLKAMQERGLTLSDVSTKAGCTIKTVSKWEQKYGISRSKSFGDYKSAEWLLLGQTLDLTQFELSNIAGCSQHSISVWEHSKNISRYSAEAHTEREWLVKQKEKGLSQRQTAKKAGVSADTIGYWYSKHDIETASGATDIELIRDFRSLANRLQHTPSAGEYTKMGEYGHVLLQKRFGSLTDAAEAAGLTPNTDHQAEADPRLYNEDWLRDAYTEMNLEEIAATVDSCSETVAKVMREQDIEVNARSSHAVKCEVLNCTVDSSVERMFARGLDNASMLEDAKYHPDKIQTEAGVWEPDFEVNGWLVECKNGDIGGRFGLEPYRQSAKMELVDQPILVFGLEEDGDSLPHDEFMEYQPGAVPDLAGLFD